MATEPIVKRALTWLMGSDTGISSKALCAHMLGVDIAAIDKRPPSDASDRGRCIRLLNLIPEWVPRLDELENLPDTWDSVVVSSAGMNTETNSWAVQVPLIRQEGGFNE